MPWQPTIRRCCSRAARSAATGFARCEERGYGLVDISPQRWNTELRAVANPLRADSRIYTLAKFTVEDRRAGPQLA